ncbi:MAG: hypothetical protein ISS82_04430, partial [Nanoarchaeota archaeon]|nr:hypothetical protein [Nanoarchaeota archaeon]
LVQFLDGRQIINQNKVCVLRGDSPVRLSVPNTIVDKEVVSRKISDLYHFDITITKNGFYDRLVFIDSPEGNVEFNEGLIPLNDSLRAHINETCGRSEYNGTDKWEVDTLSYVIYPKFIQNNSISFGENLILHVDSVLTYFIEPFVNDYVREYMESIGHFEDILFVHHYFTDTLPSALQDTVLVYGDWETTFVANLNPYLNQSINQIIAMGVSFSSPDNIPFSTILQELTQALGPIHNSEEIINSIFSDEGSDFYTSSDSLLLKYFLVREKDWRDPDTHIPN